MYNSYFWSNGDLRFLTVVESVQILIFRSLFWKLLNKYQKELVVTTHCYWN